MKALANAITNYYCDKNIIADGNCDGYVIAGTQRDVAPIIEYSCNNETSFIDSAVNTMDLDTNDMRVYYNGGLDYYIENDYELYDIQAKSIISSSKTDLKNKKVATKARSVEDKYNDDWNNALGNASNPPTNTYISDPLDYESGYNSYSMKYIAGATANMYRLMSSFANGCGAHCGPTAATNLCILNYELNDKTNLKQTSWDQTFDTLHSLSGCDHIDGAYDTDLRDAIRTYGRNRGYSSTSVAFDATPTATEMKNSIYNEKPQIFLVNGHGYYGNHFVLTVGVEQYNYTNSSTTYLRIIDGWSTGMRFINFDSSYAVSTITANFQ